MFPHPQDHLSEAGLTEGLSDILGELTSLHKDDNTKVVQRSRHTLIALHQPSYDVRHNQAESIFLSAAEKFGHQRCPENLQVRTQGRIQDFEIEGRKICVRTSRARSPLRSRARLSKKALEALGF